MKRIAENQERQDGLLGPGHVPAAMVIFQAWIILNVLAVVVLWVLRAAKP